MPAVRSSSPNDVKPYTDTRRARKSGKAAKPEPGEATPKGSKSAASRLPDGCKRALAHAVITAGLKNLPHEVAAELVSEPTLFSGCAPQRPTPSLLPWSFAKNAVFPPHHAVGYNESASHWSALADH